MLTKGETYKILNKFKNYVIQQARANLTRGKKNVTSDLYNSLEGKLKTSKNSFELDFLMEEYGYYQDRGVHGTTSSYTELGRYPTLARFGSGKGKKGKGLSQSIKEWVRKRRFQFRDKKGKFLSYNSTAFLISRSIWNKGLKPSLFFTKPFEKAFKTLPDEVIKAYGLDVEEFLKFTIKQNR